MSLLIYLQYKINTQQFVPKIFLSMSKNIYVMYLADFTLFYKFIKACKLSYDFHNVWNIIGKLQIINNINRVYLPM